uniref:Uncharacterized protein n=1 Tax=Sparus aurata TaxID=8175 RepID=A0A671W755_SPAAU
VGNETEAEDEQMNDDHPQDFCLVEVPSAADGLGSPQCPYLGSERVHNGQEAVNADAGEEEDAAVHVGVEQGHGDLAQHTPKKPLAINKVSNPKRQAEDEERVRNDKVYHVRRGLVPQLHPGGKHGDRSSYALEVLPCSCLVVNQTPHSRLIVRGFNTKNSVDC